MRTVEQCTEAYETYRKSLAAGVLNAATESNLTASISLTDSQISGSFLNRNYFALTKAKFTELKKQVTAPSELYAPTQELLRKQPVLREFLALMELGSHEVVHGLQKHSYRAVFSLVDATQSIENWEIKLFFAHASSGKKWELGKSFLTCLNSIDDESLRLQVANDVCKRCSSVVEALSIRQSGLSLAHLIEGQAYVAGRLAVKAFEAFDPIDAPLYIAAWSKFVEAGGKDPLLFVILTGAALRYGDINDDADGDTFREFYPHPVDIFVYLLNFVPELEEEMNAIASKETNEYSNSALAGMLQKAGKGAAAGASEREEKFRRLARVRNSLATDSRDEDLSYLKAKESSDDYDDEDEMRRLQARVRLNIYAAFDTTGMKCDNPDVELAVKHSLFISRCCAAIIHETYTRVGEPLKGVFQNVRKTKISNAVGADFSSYQPYYYTEELLLRAIFDQELMLGKLFPYFLDEVNERVSVKPFDHAPSMSQLEYRSMRLMPELIKGMLLADKWREGDEDFGPALVGPYCCEKHNFVAFANTVPEFFDDCPEDDAVGKAFHITFKRPVASFFD